MQVRFGGAESIGRSRAADLGFRSVVRARAESCVESPSHMTSQRGESGLFGDQMGIADWSGIGVASSRSRLSHLESTGIGRVAESQGGPGDRGHEEGSLRRVFESKQVVSMILGARITAIASTTTMTQVTLALEHYWVRSRSVSLWSSVALVAAVLLVIPGGSRMLYH